MRTQQDARLAAGDTRTLNIAVANLAGTDITGLTAKYIVAPSNPGPTTPIITKQSGAGVAIITTPPIPAGYDFIVRVSLANDDTDDVPPGWYYHEAMVTFANNAVVTVMTGQLRIDPSWIASRL
jgi:hypothetical protein